MLKMFMIIASLNGSQEPIISALYEDECSIALEAINAAQAMQKIKTGIEFSCKDYEVFTK